MSIFTEIENILNNPPLKNVRDDFDNLEALTPTNFLLGKYKNMEISGNDKNIYSGKSTSNNKAVLVSKCRPYTDEKNGRADGKM